MEDGPNDGHVRMGVGTRVVVRDLINRPELNGTIHRVLQFVPHTGRYAIVRCSANAPGTDNDNNPIALKRANLEVLPFAGTRADGRVTCITDLPMDGIEALLGHLSVRSCHRFAAVCSAANSVFRSVERCIVHQAHLLP